MTITYENKGRKIVMETEDPLLLMIGVGQEVWQTEPGDAFVERLRADEPPPVSASPSVQNVLESVWQRIRGHQDQPFKTATGLPFTYEVEGSGIWFFRDGRRINRKLSRSQVDIAVGRCPLKSTTEIKDLIDYPYLFAVLMDRRIRGTDW